MKIIKGKKQIALVLTPVELAYIRVCVGMENHISRKELVEKLFPYCARSAYMENSAVTIWKPLEKALRELEEELYNKSK